MISFMSKGLLYKDQTEILIVMVSLRIFPTRNIFNIIIDINVFNCNIHFEGTIYLFVLKVPLNLNQSIMWTTKV